MKLTYLPAEQLIIQDDADRPIVASLTMASFSQDIDIDALGRSMAAVFQLVTLANRLFALKANRDGFRVLTAFEILALWDVEVALGHTTIIHKSAE